MKIRSIERSGFTLIEVLTVIGILSILATIAFLSFGSYSQEARDTTRITDVKNIKEVVQLFKADKGIYPDPSTSVDIVHSGAVLWTQGSFGTDTVRQTGKIFGDLKDPLYNVPYQYSITSSKREYQLSYVLEGELMASRSSGEKDMNFFTAAYAATPFSPDDLNPTIWLDATDIDADGNPANNISDGTKFTVWKNKSSAGDLNNPTVTDKELQYTVDGFDESKQGVFIKNSAGLRLENSDITKGAIFYVVQNDDPFGDTDKKGTGLQSVSQNDFYIGYYDKYRDSLRVGDAPKHGTGNPATKNGRKDPYIYAFHTDNNNYKFYDGGWLISQGSTQSISGQEWGFNKAGKDGKKADFVVSEILVFDYELSIEQRQKVEGYLAHKWGLTDEKLPDDHPYKDTAPESSVTPSPDTTPDVFTISDVSNAMLSNIYVSDSITVSGVNVASPIGVSGGGEYSINDAAYTSIPSVVYNNDIVKVRQNSSALSSTSVTTTLTIGGVSEDYVVTTVVADAAPDNFSFSSVDNADVSTVYTSNAVSISGINTGTAISISGVGAEYKINDRAPSDVTGQGTASASTSYGSSTPDKAFDNQTSTSGWVNNGILPASLSYDLGLGKGRVVTKYTLYRNEDQDGGWSDDDYSPGKWSFEGSNDNVNWTILDSQSDEEIESDHTKKEYSFNNTTSFRYYRIYITKAQEDDNDGDDDHDDDDHDDDDDDDDEHHHGNWVSITEMELIDNGSGTDFTNNPGVVYNGDVVLVRMESSPNTATTKTATLTIGGGSTDYDITTVPTDSIPAAFSFNDILNASLNTIYTSNSVTISGINVGVPISISGAGKYKINNGSYVSSAGTVYDGDIVTLQQTSSALNSQIVSSTLSVSGVDVIYNVTTPAPPADAVPDSFTFNDVSNAALSTLYTSNSVTISGMNTGATLTITGGEYDVNGSRLYTNTPTTIINGDVISVRHTSSGTPNTATDTVLTIGGVSDTYTSMTVPADTTPVAFTFSDVSNATLSTTYTSNSITISGINSSSPVSISGVGEYSVNGAVYTTTPGFANNGDTITVKHTSSSSNTTTVDTVLTIGGISDTYTTTTLIGDTTPDAFAFPNVENATASTSYVSNAITVSGINTGTPVSISGAGEYSINDAAYTTALGVVNNGDSIVIRQNSSSNDGVLVSSTLTIGGVSDTYSVTTDPTPPSIINTQSTPTSNIHVDGNYNGLFAHGESNGVHYVFATPSIVASDVSNTNFIDIINSKKLVYTGYGNYPSNYVEADSSLTSTGGFVDLRLSGPVIFEGTRDELASYTGIKEIDNATRATYNNSPIYPSVSRYLDTYGTSYIEDIIGNLVGINPIKPYYCSDILDRKLVYNIATGATVTATSNTQFGGVLGVEGINNAVTSTQGKLDTEYYSDTPNAFITLSWDTPQIVGFVRIYNTTGPLSNRLSGAHISLYDSSDNLLYTHTLWDTTTDYIVDLDLEGIGKLFNNVSKVTLEGQGIDSYLNIREVEVYVGGQIQDGFYLVDSDGAGGIQPYEVYCDMTTDGGGWTKLGENLIPRGDFSGGNHISFYPGGAANFNLENNIVAKQSPASSGYAMQQKGLVSGGDSSNVDYDLIFDDMTLLKKGRELRLSAWIADAWDEGDSTDKGRGYVFKNTLTYTDGTQVKDGDRITLEEKTVNGVLWKHQMVRITLDKDAQSFVWEVGNGAEKLASRILYFTDLKAEVFYK